MQGVPPGEVLTVLTTDPASVIDFPFFCDQTGFELVSSKTEGEVLTFEIRKPLEYAGT